MTRCRPIDAAAALRWFSAAVCCSLCGLAAATGLSTVLPDGQTLTVVETSTPEHVGFSFERRYPDGMRDRQFGPGGRVFFVMGSLGGEPTTVRADTSGHIVVTGTAPLADGSNDAVVTRFLSTGQVDASWGNQGQTRLPLARSGSLAADVLPQADGGLLVVGTVEDAGLQQASIWRITASGQADTLFGQQGAMFATALPSSRALSIQAGPDGATQIAVQTSEGGKSWIEVHQWRTADAFPLRIARQELPEQWVGPPSLELRAGQWVWLDPSQPESPMPVAMLKQPDSPWRPLDPTLIAAAKTADQPGQAAMNPYAGMAISVNNEPSEPGATSSWLNFLVGSVLLAGAVIWSFRH